MLLIETNSYRAELNPRSGNLVSLERTRSGHGGNLIHMNNDSAFGSLAYSSRQNPPTWQNTGSPIDVSSYVLAETHLFAMLESREETPEGTRLTFINPMSGHRLNYLFGADYIDLTVAGDIPEADQVALDLHLAMMDLRQNDPRDEQFNLQSFYCNSERSLCYCHFCRPVGDGVTIRSLTRMAGWRLIYRPENHAVCGFQMVGRFDSRFDPSAKPGEAFEFGVRLSLEDSLDSGLERIYRETGMPRILMPVLGGEVGQHLPFQLAGQVESLVLTTPDGSRKVLPPESGVVELAQEGFYLLQARTSGAPVGEVTLHAASDVKTTLKRSAKALTPIFGGCAETWYWVQALCLNRQWSGADADQDAWLRVALCTLGMQGCEHPAVPAPLTPDETAVRLSSELSWGHYFRHDGKFYPYLPSPEAHEFNGRMLSPFHLYRWERIQDGFEFIRTYLIAAETFECDAYYEHAIKIAQAHLNDHFCADGALRCIREWDRLPIDYTTVIAPLQVLVELYVAMNARGDERGGEIRDVCCRIADFLVNRGLEFPTEGASVHLRWSEDGSISCTALSLLTVYRYMKADQRYLDTARKVLHFHKSWQLHAPDVRVHGGSFRYWETQWENDGEGRAINAGHAWNLWQAEALYLLALIDHDTEALIDSWNGFRANMAKFHPDGSCSSCFTPDYLPMRPRKLKLYHSYAEKSDRSLAFYLWPRLNASWNQGMAVIAPEAARLSADAEVICLNCRVKSVGNQLHVEAFSEFSRKLYVKGQDLAQRIVPAPGVEVEVWE